VPSTLVEALAGSEELDDPAVSALLGAIAEVKHDDVIISI
jgi:hypothetical protein